MEEKCWLIWQKNKMNSNKIDIRQASFITTMGIVLNITLSFLKITVGIFGKSNAILADGIHSLSDLFTDFATIFFVFFGRRKIDKTHKYGHGKFETLGSIIIGLTLVLVGILVIISSTQTIIKIYNATTVDKPSIWALVIAVISIITKEALFKKTKTVGEKIRSSSIIANAYHHRSDAFSSIATTIGISGAIILGNRWIILDPIAAIVVGILIVKMSFDILITALNELMEKSLPEKIEKEIIECIKSVDGVKNVHNLKTRQIGPLFAIEVHVKVDKTLSVVQSHNIATSIENKLKDIYGKETHIGIHIEPF